MGNDLTLWKICRNTSDHDDLCAEADLAGILIRHVDDKLLYTRDDGKVISVTNNPRMAHPRCASKYE